MKATSLYEQLQGALQPPTPMPILLGTFGLPLVIAYLAQYPNNRPLRIGVWMLAATCCVWSWLTIDLAPMIRIRIATPGMTWIFGSCLYWAFTGAVPVTHPLPRQPLLSPLRQWKPFKALDLYYNMHRHVNIAGFSPPLRRFRGSGVMLYIRFVLYHLFFTALGVFMLDLSSYPIFRLAPDTLGSAACVPTGDFKTFIRDVGGRYGVPVWAVRVACTIALGSITHFGITLIWHAFAMFSIASGIYTPEEFPTFTKWPVLATSLNELWSKRWHQLMRDFYLIVCSPLKSLPRPLYILAIFAFSGIYHILIYYPVQRNVVVYPYLLFYIGNGLACIAERAFRSVTGKRVGGVWGWLWTWAFLYVISQPLVEEEYSSGWAGCMRDVFTKEPEKSMVIGMVHALGWGPSPAEIIAQRRAEGHLMIGKAS